MASQPIRVAIYPDIPDLAGDNLEGLKQFIADAFKKVSGQSIQVTTDVSSYKDLEKFKSTYLTDDRDAYDVIEVDTKILGELVKTGCLQALEDHFTVTEDDFTSSAVHSVHYPPNLKSHLYGVPTLICAKFLMEFADVDHSPQIPLLKDWASFGQLKDTLDQAEGSGHSLLLKRDFYPPRISGNSMGVSIDEHGTGRGSVCTDTDGKVAESKLILIYAYSERMGEVLQMAAKKKKHKKTLCIVSPPLDDSNKLLTYTDALVVNKSKFEDGDRADVIKKFV